MATERAPANKTTLSRWQDIKCLTCGQTFASAADGHFEHDIVTGGLKGIHKVCPKDAAVVTIHGSAESQLKLVIAVANILRERIRGLSPNDSARADHLKALDEALEPFEGSKIIDIDMSKDGRS